MSSRTIASCLLAIVLGVLGATLYKQATADPSRLGPLSSASTGVNDSFTGPAPAEVALQKAEQEIFVLQGDVEILEAMLAEANAQVAAERAAKESYQAGLQGAVAQLNKLSQDDKNRNAKVALKALSDLGKSSNAASKRPRYDANRYVYVRRPGVSAVGSTVVVAGSVHNASSRQVYGMLEVVVTRGRSRERLTFEMTIPPRTVRRYHEEIRLHALENSATAAATWYPA